MNFPEKLKQQVNLFITFLNNLKDEDQQKTALNVMNEKTKELLKKRG